jgi:hypothetical protein
MGRSPESAPLHVTHHSIARLPVRDRRYKKRCWRAAVAVAILGLAGTAHSADAPPLLSPEQMNASEIQLALQKLNVLGRVLYIAAHPDDENTNLMAFWANGSLYDAAYLSITRGDGGQNLIGPELGERLGVIRTEELLDARRIDHAQQFFTRATDFGFSKTADETMRIWDHDKILADVVWVVRNCVHGNRGGQYQYAQEPGRRRPAATRRAKRIFQTVGRPADDQLAFRRRGHELVARCEFRIHCRRNSSDHFEVQSRRSSRICA